MRDTSGQTGDKTDGVWNSIAEIKRINAERGHRFFSSYATRTFHRRVESEVISGQYFITSERTERPKGILLPPRYSVCVALPDGTIHTVGGQGAYASLAEARAAIDRLVRRDRDE